MKKACSWIPKVKVGEEFKDSKLFTDINKITHSYNQTKDIYFRVKNPEFLRLNPGIKKDSNGEPLLSEIVKIYDLGEAVTEISLMENYQKELNEKVKDIPTYSNLENYMSFMDKVIEFNDGNPDYIADIVENNDELSVRVVKNTKDLRKIYLQKKKNHILNRKLISILKEHGVSIGVLDELELRLSVNGVTDFSVAKNAAEGMVELIRIANGNRGQQVLPEEFAHAVLEMLNGTNLVNRLQNIISENNLVQEILGEEYSLYNELYEQDQSLLVKEAAGKLVAKHLLENDPIPDTSYKNILQRLIDAIKEFFSSWSTYPFINAIEEADKVSNTIAKELLTGDIMNNASLSNIIETRKLYNAENKTDKVKTTLENIYKTELKRLKIYGKRDKNFEDKQKIVIYNIEKNIKDHTEIMGIISYIKNSIDILKSLKQRAAALDENSPVTLDDFSEVARLLRNISQYINSYSSNIPELLDIIKYSDLQEDSPFIEKGRAVLDEFKDLIEACSYNYQKHAFPIFEKFMEPFLEHELEVPFGKYKGKKFTGRQLLTIAEKDISFMERWLDSMAHSSSPILRALDEVVKKTKSAARLETVDFNKRIDALYAKAKRNGITDFEFMFEKDEKGDKTGKYIRREDFRRYNKERKELIEQLTKKYGNNSSIYYSEEWKSFMDKAWEGEKGNRKLTYIQPAYANMTSSQKEFYEDFLELKEELDGMLPDHVTNLYNAVKIRKDLWQRIKDNNFSSLHKQLWEATKDNFMRRSDDEDYNSKRGVTDFSGRQVFFLPLYYLKIGKGESMNDISTDILGTLKAYSAMAIDYNHMNKIVDILEVGREQLEKKLEVIKTEGGNKLEEEIKGVIFTSKSYITKNSKNLLILDRIDDFMQMQVYSRYMDDEGTVLGTKIDTAKLAGHLAGLTAINALGINLLAGISNALTGNAMAHIEVGAKQFFKAKDLLVADGYYTKSLPAYLGDVGKKVKTSKLHLFDELFNVLQDFEETNRNAFFDRAAIFAKMFGTDTLFFMTNGGEHWMQNRTALAVANTYRFKRKGDNSGETINLYDALEVVYTDPNHKNAGASLKIMDGYVYVDKNGNEREWTKEDTTAFELKVQDINQKLHGIYNRLDRAAFQKLAIGRLAFMFRKWMKEFYNRRWSSVKYNHMLQEYEEGYYNSLGRFIKQMYQDLKKGQLAIGANYRNLHDVEKANIRRGLTDIAQFSLVLLALALVEGISDKDKYKKKKWYFNMLKYQIYRLKTELGIGVPSHLMLQEITKIVDSPLASTSIMEDLLATPMLLWPGNYGEDAELKSGRFKGHSKAYKIFYESPYMVWALKTNKQIYRALHPEESIPFYK